VLLRATSKKSTAQLKGASDREATLFQKPVIKPASRANLFFLLLLGLARSLKPQKRRFLILKKVTTRANFVKLLIG